MEYDRMLLSDHTTCFATISLLYFSLIYCVCRSHWRRQPVCTCQPYFQFLLNWVDFMILKIPFGTWDIPYNTRWPFWAQIYGRITQYLRFQSGFERNISLVLRTTWWVQRRCRNKANRHWQWKSHEPNPPLSVNNLRICNPTCASGWVTSNLTCTMKNSFLLEMNIEV